MKKKRMMKGAALFACLMLGQGMMQSVFAASAAIVAEQNSSANVASAQTVAAQENSPSGEEFLKNLKGTYIELFSSETCLNPKYDALWKSEATKYVGEEKADGAVKQLVGGCQGTRTGDEAVEYFKQQGGMQFCCHFLQGVRKITFSGNRISGVNKDGKRLFSRKYRFVGKDAEGNFIYESMGKGESAARGDKDKQPDEFRYFWMRPDSPAETHHIEFRYGSDKELLTQLMAGKYAYWMASGVRVGHEDEWQKSIVLFVGENLGAL